jgi:hypothetical protein
MGCWSGRPTATRDGIPLAKIAADAAQEMLRFCREFWHRRGGAEPHRGGAAAARARPVEVRGFAGLKGGETVLEGLIGLSDQQMDTIVWATAPLTPRERALFLVDMAQALRGQEIDDEAVARACVEARRRSERT